MSLSLSLSLFPEGMVMVWAVTGVAPYRVVCLPQARSSMTASSSTPLAASSWRERRASSCEYDYKVGPRTHSNVDQPVFNPTLNMCYYVIILGRAQGHPHVNMIRLTFIMQLAPRSATVVRQWSIHGQCVFMLYVHSVIYLTTYLSPTGGTKTISPSPAYQR